MKIDGVAPVREQARADSFPGEAFYCEPSHLDISGAGASAAWLLVEWESCQMIQCSTRQRGA